MLTLSYLYIWQKFNNKANDKKKPGVSEYGHPEYATSQINSCIQELLLRQFCLIFAAL